MSRMAEQARTRWQQAYQGHLVLLVEWHKVQIHLYLCQCFGLTVCSSQLIPKINAATHYWTSIRGQMSSNFTTTTRQWAKRSTEERTTETSEDKRTETKGRRVTESWNCSPISTTSPTATANKPQDIYKLDPSQLQGGFSKEVVLTFQLSFKKRVYCINQVPLGSFKTWFTPNTSLILVELMIISDNSIHIHCWNLIKSNLKHPEPCESVTNMASLSHSPAFHQQGSCRVESSSGH